MNVITNMDQIDQLIDSGCKLIILCKTHDCGVCLSVEARLEKDAELYNEWTVIEVFVDDLPLFRGNHTVYTVPTVLMFFEGKEIYRTSRFIDYGKINYFVEILSD